LAKSNGPGQISPASARHLACGHVETIEHVGDGDGEQQRRIVSIQAIADHAELAGLDLALLPGTLEQAG
jgi:hypothetical protein